MIRSGGEPVFYSEAARLADAIVERVGKTIVLALPLGLGKANHIANALYAKAVADRSIKLTIFTGLTLEPPHAKAGLERRFLEPLAQRVFAGYPRLDYAAAIHAGHGAAECHRQRILLRGRTVARLAVRAAALHLGQLHPCPAAISLDRGVNVVAQLVAQRPATARPLQPQLQHRPDARPSALAPRKAVCNSCSPPRPIPNCRSCGGEAALGADEFDMVLDNPAPDFPLFAPPPEPISDTEYAIGLHAATSCPMAAHCRSASGRLATRWRRSLILRHRDNASFATSSNGCAPMRPLPSPPQLAPFSKWALRRQLRCCWRRFSA